MSLKDRYKGKHEDCVNRIRFKQLEVDADRVYDELWNRIEMSERKTGVFPIWKYISAVACIALLCVSSFYASWVMGNYVFENSTFGQIIRVLEHSFNVKVHLKDSLLEDVCLTARFTHGESLEEILSVLQISMRYTYTIRGKDVFIE